MSCPGNGAEETKAPSRTPTYQYRLTLTSTVFIKSYTKLASCFKRAFGDMVYHGIIVKRSKGIVKTIFRVTFTKGFLNSPATQQLECFFPHNFRPNEMGQTSISQQHFLGFSIDVS